MSVKRRRQVSFSPDVNEKLTAALRSETYATARPQKRDHRRGFSSRLMVLSPMRFLRHVGTNMVKALRLVSWRRPSAKSPVSPGVPRRLVVHGDSYSTEAIEDCIQFIKSSYEKSF